MQYPKIVLIDRIQSENEIIITRNKLCNVEGSKYLAVENQVAVAPQVSGELLYKGFILSDSYDWIIGQDSTGCLMLVPLKKL